MEPEERFRLEALRADVAAQARALREVSDPRSGVDRRAAELADQHLADLAKRGIERRGGDRRVEANSGRQERGMRRRLKHEWLASLSPEQRAAERQLRRRATAIACLAVIAPAVVLAACALLLSLGAGVLAVAAVTYLVLIIGNRVRHVRDERRLFAEHAERMRPQLDRVIEATNRAARHSA